jgi:hypothetical protein
MDTLVLPDPLAARLYDYLDVPYERMAFLLATAEVDADTDRWTARDDLYLDDDLDYAYQGPLGMELSDHVRPRVLQWASRVGAALVEVHAHGPSKHPTSFSPTDLTGLRDAVPQMLWRLSGRPYTALVVGNGDLDALTWARRGAPARTLSAVVVGSRTLHPTGLAGTLLAPAEES